MPSTLADAKPEQFKLNDEGQILYQEKVGSPLPGAPVAALRKGQSVLAPVVEPVEANDENKAALQKWLDEHIKTVLEPLVALHNDSELTSPVKDIAEKVYESLGIVPREQIEDLIAALDTDTRRTVRAKRIRLGPVLVFQPDLNKPAAVRLRGTLWSLFNGKPLPAPLPNDGVVSFTVDPNTVDRDFHQVIGYPVYGPRAIRIDMLDRVINAIYEQAQGGKFQARHEMAEWFGCPIQDLYAVLEAMGHTKLNDPHAEAAKAEEEKAPEAAIEEGEKPAEENKPQEKPELATFRLKKGKAFQKASGDKAQKPKKDFKRDNKDKKKGKRNKSENRGPKVMSAEAKIDPQDNPFAVLQQLKKAGK
ncbi:MAG: hypothetical protein KDJ35_07265 [Alphaproteobacteria bacterium]|nr:hypothetical protein [Alphaproteobacteria bacterium]